MVRKFLNKKQDELDDESARRVELSKNQSTGETAPFEELREDILSANKQIHSLANHLSYQTMKIEKIKRIHEDFEHELDILNGGDGKTVSTHDIKKTEFENLEREFESKKIIGNITSTVEKHGQDRISMLEKQLENERINAVQFNKKIQEDLIKFNIIEEALKSDKGKLESIIKEKTERLVNSEKMSAIGDLASRLAHDMKNPLTVIKGSIQVIKKMNQGKMDDFSLKRIEVIESAIFRMAHQIDNVLDYVKATPLEITQNSLVEILVSAIELVQVPQNITINLPVSDFVISCDQNKLTVVFSNLILNSVQALEMERGAITVRATKNNAYIVIEVEDSGPGISSDVLPKIFDPLFTTKQVGTGLGLSSCKRIIEQHGGTIGVSNNPTRFSIILPC